MIGDPRVVSSPGWPAVVWDSPLLRGLDVRSRGEIEAAGRLRSVRAKEIVYRVGDPADVLFVLASGAIALFGIRRGDADALLLRRLGRGETFGEEGTVAAFSTRQLEARCEADGLVAEIPLVVLRRAIGRAGGAPAMANVERALRRAATLDLFRTTSFTRGLSEADLEVFLDAAKHLHKERGEHVYREGDPANEAFLVADGLLQAQTDDEGKPRIEGYLARGDLFGDEELKDREPRGVAVVASGPTWLVAIPRDVFLVVARRNEAALEAARRIRSEPGAPRLPAGTQTTAHVFRDLYRMRVARSLLVIDQDSCIRCGHCAWSCAEVHDDGVSRLVRRGDKIVVDAGSGAAPEPAKTPASRAPLLVPNSCQHCKNPSCMIDCPTGAIGRDARGEVFIREDLCTGCGSCAKACPWENIQMAPRADALPYPAVAVKCDLCKGVDGGPACVAACPTQAIARIDPNAALVELQLPTPHGAPAPAAPVLPPRSAAWPWVLGAALASLGVAVSGIGLGRFASGVVAGVGVLLLVLYAATKRVRIGPVARWVAGRGVHLARLMYIGHLALGVLTAGITFAHAGSRVTANAGGALLVALGVAILTGAGGALLATVLPRALSRIERKSVLPEELAERPREIDEKIFRSLSGKSELVKTLWLKELRPYRAARLGPVALLARRASLREEEKRVRARLDALAGGKTRTLAALDDLVRLVVEHRAVRAQRLVTWLLRGWLVPHLAATAAAIVLLVLHVVAVTAPEPGRPAPAKTAASGSPR